MYRTVCKIQNTFGSLPPPFHSSFIISWVHCVPYPYSLPTYSITLFPISVSFCLCPLDVLCCAGKKKERSNFTWNNAWGFFSETCLSCCSLRILCHLYNELQSRNFFQKSVLNYHGLRSVLLVRFHLHSFSEAVMSLIYHKYGEHGMFFCADRLVE